MEAPKPGLAAGGWPNRDPAPAVPYWGLAVLPGLPFTPSCTVGRGLMQLRCSGSDALASLVIALSRKHNQGAGEPQAPSGARLEGCASPGCCLLTIGVKDEALKALARQPWLSVLIEVWTRGDPAQGVVAVGQSVQQQNHLQQVRIT